MAAVFGAEVAGEDTGLPLEWHVRACRIGRIKKAASGCLFVTAENLLLGSQLVFQIVNVDTAALETFVIDQLFLQRGIGLDATNNQFIQG